MSQVNKLSTQAVSKSFFQYLIPTLIGMSLMSVNIVVDGIFVGHGVGSVALAGVNVAVPVFSIILSIALLIGVGGGAVYSMTIGRGELEHAKRIFTTSFVILTLVTSVVAIVSYLFKENLAYFFGANDETLPYVLEYMKVLLIFSLFVAWESALSIFVRNDGNPNLAMVGLIVTSILNIGLNYYMVFILKLGVTGAALATVIATIAGLLVLMTHFLNKKGHLKFVKIKYEFKDISRIASIGFPSFVSEMGMGVFVIGYNIAIAHYAGTNGLAAFSVINYLHTFMFLVFIGIGSSIQPMISYYYGAQLFNHIKETIKIAEKTAVGLGALFLVIGFFGADLFVSMFGVTSEAITELAVTGIRLFFIGYLFMGINFIYLTYFQAIGYVKPSLWITLFRGFILLIIMLLVLPRLFGINGVWLALPVAEAVMAFVLIFFARQHVLGEVRPRNKRRLK